MYEVSLTWFVTILKNSTSSDFRRLWLTFYSSNQLPLSTLSIGCFSLECRLSLNNVCGPQLKFPGRSVVVMFLDIRWARLARSQWMLLIFPYRLVCVKKCLFWVTSGHHPRWKSQSCDAHVTSRVCRCVGGDSGAEEHRREAVGGSVVVGGARCLPRLRRHWCSLQRLLPRLSRSRHATLLPHAKILKLNLKSSHLRSVFMRLTVYACHIIFSIQWFVVFKA